MLCTTYIPSRVSIYTLFLKIPEVSPSLGVDYHGQVIYKYMYFNHPCLTARAHCCVSVCIYYIVSSCWCQVTIRQDWLNNISNWALGSPRFKWARIFSICLYITLTNQQLQIVHWRRSLYLEKDLDFSTLASRVGIGFVFTLLLCNAVIQFAPWPLTTLRDEKGWRQSLLIIRHHQKNSILWFINTMYIAFKQLILAFIYTIWISEGTASTIYIKLIRQGLKRMINKNSIKLDHPGNSHWTIKK